MPTSSIDTFFACSLMVVLIVSAMVGTAKVVQPYVNNLTDMNSGERFKGLAEYLLLNNGYPSDWGKMKGNIPTAFGLASEALLPYGLDLDKVSRLNSDSVYSLSYQEILKALGTKDTSLNIKIHPLFRVSINLTSNKSEETETTYTFQISTSKSSYPLSAWLHCYVFVKAYVDNVFSSTASDGTCFVNATLPNSVNGTALFIVFAKSKLHSQMVAFSVYSFGHNSKTPKPNKTFLQLSSLNHVLNLSFQCQTVEVSSAHVFTCNYNFNLSQSATGNQTAEYGIPSLLEDSPMILVVNGKNTSTSFVEWTGYPQLPLEIGADFRDLTSISSVVAFTYIVNINSVLYELIITCRSV